MKANELMIGDWVQIVSDAPTMPNEYHTVDWIRTGEIGLDNRAIVTYPFIQPIPLTPEILEKNGFSGKGYNMGVVGFHTDPIPEVKDGYEVFIWKDMCLEIKHGFTHLKRYAFYVHELQHALRLCGIDKEITI